ncbi:hypothetical protein [Pseudoroseicyclus aestuarii]|uniref:PemK-like, MazF-like toxin of type II toxin-antitoxin system n=1 Tax=Pseudoroseicyclus aestuarii TaxID=1795041 RepID=A0A318T6E0_9RHOB|nr:hypothetical protein [Pseudoroseicyclus aestuarii]PYE83948.1 hypothetical protein DFP88_103310 [Pseudoroseicyclus aestuarii]
MLDSTTTILAMTPAWQDHLSPGDIVSFRFPVREAGPGDRLKARPCLVLEIEEMAGQRFALLAYGTSSPRRANWGYEVHALHHEDHATFGLDRPTRFIGKRRLMVSLDNSGFASCRGTGSPVLGQLSGGPAERLLVVRARIQAERDMAAEMFADRRRRRMAPVVVERRRPKQMIRAGGAA